jgi:hypothetical protein
MTNSLQNTQLGFAVAKIVSLFKRSTYAFIVGLLLFHMRKCIVCPKQDPRICGARWTDGKQTSGFSQGGWGATGANYGHLSHPHPSRSLGRANGREQEGVSKRDFDKREVSYWFDK